MILEFEKVKETKNTIRYQEIEKDGWAKIGSLYVQKAAVSQESLGDKITVEIKPSLRQE